MIVLDFISYGFAALIVFTVVGVILSFIFHQVEFLKRAWLYPERVSLRKLVSPWTRRILDGSAMHPFREALRVCERDPTLTAAGYRRIVAELDKLISELKMREPDMLVRKTLHRELIRLRAVYARKRDSLIVEAETQEVHRGRTTLMRAG